MFRKKNPPPLPDPREDPFNTWVQDQVDQAQSELDESWERWREIVLPKKRNGWHYKALTTTNRTSGTTRTWLVTWRTQFHECHNQTWATWDGERCPVSQDFTNDWGIPLPVISQCGNCGSLMQASYTLREEKDEGRIES